MTATPTKPPLTRRQLRRKRILLVVIVAYVGFVVATISQDFILGQWQDKCAIGAVPNAQYRKWKAIAAENAVEPSGKSLNALFDLIAKDVTSIEERVAIAHAVMRAYGFTFHAATPGWAKAQEDGGVTFNYRKAAWSGVVLACMIDCEDRGYFRYYLKAVPSSQIKPNDFYLNYSPARGGYRAPALSAPQAACPPVPDAAWTDEFLKKLKP